MNGIYGFAALGFITGSLYLTGISLFSLLPSGREGEKGRGGFQGLARKKKKQKYWSRKLEELKQMLAMTNREGMFAQVVQASMIGVIIGGSLALWLGNWFLVPILAYGGMSLPFWYIQWTQERAKKAMHQEMETALSVLTTGYLRTGHIVTAMEENLSYLQAPIASVFQQGLYQMKYVNPDVEQVLREMRDKIPHPAYHAWIDGVLQCQQDRSLIPTLLPITQTCSEMRRINGELELFVSDPRQEFFTLVAFVLGNVPLLYVLNQDWYEILMESLPGQVVAALCMLAIVWSVPRVIGLCKPIE